MWLSQIILEELQNQTLQGTVIQKKQKHFHLYNNAANEFVVNVRVYACCNTIFAPLYSM